MRVDRTIDWLQYSTTFYPSWVPKVEAEHEYSPLPGYKAHSQHESGVTIHAGHPTGRMLVTVPGKACKALDVSPEWVKLHYPGDARASRVDFAATVQCREDLLLWLVWAIQKNQMTSKRFEGDTPKVIGRADGGIETVYIGDQRKRAKKGIFRAYDKALEAGIQTDERILRFELEIKREQAQTALKRWTKGTSIGAIIRDVVDLPGVEWWSQVMGQKRDAMPRYDTEEKEPQTVAWLVEQVAPALAKVIVSDTDNGTQNAQAFYKSLDTAIGKLLGLH
jgi:hypothetical protein